MGPVDEDERWAPFKDMHQYLRTTFPLVYVLLLFNFFRLRSLFTLPIRQLVIFRHSHLNLTIIGGYSLVYTWKGTVAESKPLMLTGHIDVVPR